jgi:hypothetical protein
MHYNNEATNEDLRKIQERNAAAAGNPSASSASTRTANPPRVRVDRPKVTHAPTRNKGTTAPTAPTQTSGAAAQPKPISFDHLISTAENVVPDLPQHLAETLKRNIEILQNVGRTTTHSGGTSDVELMASVKSMQDIFANARVSAMASGDTKKTEAASAAVAAANVAQESLDNTGGGGGGGGNQGGDGGGDGGDGNTPSDSEAETMTDEAQGNRTSTWQEDVDKSDDELRQEQGDREQAHSEENGESKPEEEKPAERKSSAESSLEEIAKTLSSLRERMDKSDKSSLLKNILGTTLAGGYGIWKYYQDKKDREARDESARNMMSEIDKRIDALKGDPTNPALKSGVEKALQDSITKNRADIIAEAAKSIKKDKADRLKTANDIGLNFGNFGKIFSSGTNRDSLHGINDLSHLLNIQSRQINPYL